MKHLRYLGLVTLMAVMTCNTSGQTVRQKDRVISGNANLSKLDTEGPGALKTTKTSARPQMRTGTVFASAAHIHIKDGRKVDPN
jgi:hypothetical protein